MVSNKKSASVMAAYLTGKLIFLTVVCITGIASENIGIEAVDKEKIVTLGQNVTMLCKATFPITACSFKSPGKSGELLYVNEHTSPEILERDGFGYFGRGFSQGECGLFIKKITEENSGEYECSAPPPPSIQKLNSAKIRLIVARIEPVDKEKVVMLGQNVTMLCKATFPIAACSFKFPGRKGELSYLSEHTSPGILERDGYGYYGRGFKQGECGLFIKKITEENNGEYKCNVPPPPGVRELNSGKIRLIVAKPPERPVFIPQVRSFYKIGDRFELQCKIANGRPRPQILWFIDDIPLYDRVSQPIFIDSGDNNLQTVTQNFSKILTMADNDRVIKCATNHTAVSPDRSYTTARISIAFGPAPKDDPIYIYGVKIGESTQLNITIQANPIPSAIWTVDGEVLSFSYSPGRFHPSPIVSLGNGFYNSSLGISIVERKDTDKKFQVIAENSIGRMVYNVKITTSEEAEEFAIKY